MENLYECQLERVEQWEAWWRARIKSEMAGPPLGKVTTLLLEIDAEYKRRISRMEAELAGTCFESGGARLHELTRDTVPARGAIADKFQAKINLTELRFRHWHFERQVTVCLDAGVAPTDIIHCLIKGNVLFCKGFSPVFMQWRLSCGAGRDVFPMLAGLASAQMFIGQNRLRRQKALEVIFWQEHSRALHPFPSKMQLRAVLREQALHAIPRLLPFVSQADSHQHIASLAAQQGFPPPERFPLTQKQAALPTLRFLHDETGQALLKLPTALDNYIRDVSAQDGAIDEKGFPPLPMLDWQKGQAAVTQQEAWNNDPLASFLRDEDNQTLLSFLSTAERETFLLLRDGLTQKEIAARRNESLSAVEKRLSRLIKRNSRAA